MYAMRYDITLADDYDMTTIKERVAQNGHLMNNFQDLLFKVYLISEIEKGEKVNSYSPLYVWKGSKGMNKFIFEGYYDNILRDFGWQNIEIAVASAIKLNDNFAKSKYVIEEVVDILPNNSLKQEDMNAELVSNQLGKLIVYNPDKWKKSKFFIL